MRDTQEKILSSFWGIVKKYDFWAKKSPEDKVRNCLHYIFFQDFHQRCLKNSFEGTRNIREKILISFWKNVETYNFLGKSISRTKTFSFFCSFFYHDLHQWCLKVFWGIAKYSWKNTEQFLRNHRKTWFFGPQMCNPSVLPSMQKNVFRPKLGQYQQNAHNFWLRAPKAKLSIFLKVSLAIIWYQDKKLVFQITP